MDHKLNHILDAKPLDFLISSVENRCKDILPRSLYLNASLTSDNKSASVHELKTGLEAQASALESILPNLVSRIRTTANSLAPLHRLPDEILVMVFRELVQRHTMVSAVLQLSRVCNKWRILLSSTPSFWTHLNISDTTKPEIVALCLERSKEASLDINFAHLEQFKENSITHMLDMMRPILALPQHVRALSFVVKQGHFGGIVPFLTNANAPRLESLHISTRADLHPNNTQDTSYAINTLLLSLGLFSYTPSLRSLKIEGFHIPWCSPLYNDLTHLSIEIPKTESLTRLFSALRLSPKLETLYLLQRTGLSVVAQAEDLGVMSLPQLTELKIHNFALLDFRSIIGHISMPTIKYVQLAITARSSLSLADLFHCFPPEILACFRSTKHIKLCASYDQHGIRCWPTTQETEKHSHIFLPSLNSLQPSTATFQSILAFLPHTTILSLVGASWTLPPIINGYHDIQELRLAVGVSASIRGELGLDGCLSSVRVLHIFSMRARKNLADLSAVAALRSNIRVLRLTGCPVVTSDMIASFRNVGLSVEWCGENTITDGNHQSEGEAGVEGRHETSD